MQWQSDWNSNTTSTQTTWASHSNIFVVLAAVHTNSTIWAVEERGLGPCAPNIVKKDSTTATAKVGTAVSCSTCEDLQLKF